jgi:glycosyltransferase involved in cell wall biosynthesis
LSQRKTLIVCDYENEREGYTFPNFGMGSSENRIWHFAHSATCLPHLRVVIVGPRWLPEHVPGAIHFPERLHGGGARRFREQFGRADYLFAGHEYFDKQEWVEPFLACAKSIFTYQLHPYEYQGRCFDGVQRILFCYSDEMCEQYQEQRPMKGLLFHSGVDERPVFNAAPEDYLLWMGRLDSDKQPHIAVEVAARLGMRLVILGETVRDPDYGRFLDSYLSAPHVEYAGVLRGPEKTRLLSSARCAIYTVSREFTEAGAGVLGEYLASGVPIAGMTWKGNDAVCEAVDRPEFGRVVNASVCHDEQEIVSRLSRAVSECLELDRAATHRLGRHKYDPVRLVHEMLQAVDRAAVNTKAC